MTLPVAFYLALGVEGVAAGAAAQVDSLGGPLIALAALVTAAVTVWRFAHVGQAWKSWRERKARQYTFYLDWYGEPARPGVEARIGVPESLAKLATQYHEIKGRDGQLVVALEELTRWATENGQKIDRVDNRVLGLDDRVLGLDQRVTDHRRRNDEQARLLADDLKRRAADLEAKVAERDDALGQRLGQISDDLLRAETMRAALVELGLDIDPRPKENPWPTCTFQTSASGNEPSI